MVNLAPSVVQQSTRDRNATRPEDLPGLLVTQRAAFLRDGSPSLAQRRAKLKTLRAAVLARKPEHIRALVYLDAFVLQDGENQMQHLTEAQSRQFREGVNDLGEGWKVPPIPAAAFNVNVADREWVDRQCTVQPIGTMEQPLSLTGGIQKIENVTFILATGYTPGSPFPPFYEKAKAKGWHTQTVPCGHDVMLDLPKELISLLVEAGAPSC